MITIQELRTELEEQVGIVQEMINNFEPPMYAICPRPGKMHAIGYLEAITNILDALKGEQHV